MKVQSPDPQPRDDGEYDTYVNGVAYGKPRGKIYLDEGGALALENITLDDARRLARAVAQVERELAAAHARMTAPHGTGHFYHDTCQLCGKPADDALHAEDEPPRQALITLACGCSFTGPVPSVKIAYCAKCDRHEEIRTAVIADDRAAPAGAADPAYPDVPGAPVLPDCTRDGCGHPESAHMADDDVNADGPCLELGCQCLAYLVPETAVLAAVRPPRSGFVSASQPILLGAKVRTGGAS